MCLFAWMVGRLADEASVLPFAATTITGDGPCYATNVSYRLDTPGARAFLAPFVKLP